MKWSLTMKLAGWGAVMAALVFTLSAYTVHRLAVMNEDAEKSRTEAMVPLEDGAGFVVELSELRTLIHNHVDSSDTEAMAKIEADIEATLKRADELLAHLGTAEDRQEINKLWENLAATVKDARDKSKNYLKLEALDAVSGTQWRMQSLALEQKISALLSQAIKKAQRYQESSKGLRDRTKTLIIAASAAVFFLSVFIGIALARSIGIPLRQVAETAVRIGRGDLRAEVPLSKRKDEIGQVGDAFRQMLANLKEQMTKVLEVVESLSSVSSDLSVSLSQLSRNASSTSSAIREVTATVAEVSQAARLSNEKADNVARTSQEALKASASGRTATEKTIEKMQLMRAQMASIGQTVVSLNERSRAIENIVFSVQDLTDQSNLLAVNASIEAARAGDSGKGFAVVSHEIKVLADQSRAATDQIRNMLKQTKEGVDAVVEATEHGSEAVAAGVEQSVLAGDSMRLLMTSVSNSAEAAGIISASSEEQREGVEQVVRAVNDIEASMNQNLEGISHVENAAMELEKLGDTLNGLVKYYSL